MWPLLAVATAAVLVRVAFFEVPMISDEGAYAYVADAWRQGQLPYRDVPLDRPQGLFLVYRAAVALGDGTVPIRLMGALFAAITAAASFVLARDLFGRGAGWIAGLSCAVVSASPALEGFTANAEVFAMAPLAISAMACWRKQWWLAGMAAGISVTMKPIGLSGLLLAIALILIERGGWRAMWKLALAFSIPPLLCFLHGAIIGWSYYWASFVDRRLLAYSMASSSFSDQLSLFVDSLLGTLPALMAIGALALGVVLGLRDRRASFCTLYVLSAIAGMAMGGLWHAHYFQQIVPPLAVGASGLLLLRERASILHRMTEVAAAAGAVWFVVTQIPYYWQEPGFVSWNLYHRPAYVLADELVDSIEAHSEPGDRLYVAFAEAELYYLSDRRAVVPQLFWREVAFIPGLFEQIVASIEAAEAAVVVLGGAPPRDKMSAEEFLQVVERRYRRVDVVGPFAIYARSTEAFR